MADLTTRAYRPDDAADVADLYNASREAFGGKPAYTADETRAITGAMIADPAVDSRLVHAPDGTLVAAGMVSTPPRGGFRIDLLGAVHPQWCGRGLGRELLGWQVDRAREIHRSRGGETGWVIETGSSEDDTSRIRLLKRMGFTAVRYFFDMVAPTKQPPAVALPEGLRSEPYRPERARELYEAHVEAFQDHWGSQRREFDSWVTYTVQSPDFNPELSRIAFDGEQIAGYLLAYQDALPERFYIGQVGTRRPWRRRGLAAALLVEVLTAAAAAGRDEATLGVDAESPTGAVGVYERVGFEVEERGAAYQIPLG